ncbi:12328_t:CDS:2, partial [Ambispora gerdemannii]
MDRRKKYQAQVYRSWNAIALGLPNKPGEPEPEEPEIKQSTKPSWRPPPGVLVKEVIGQKAPSQIAEWRYANAVALNKVLDIVPKDEIYESCKWDSEQKQRKSNWGASSVRGVQQNNRDSSLQQGNWDSHVSFVKPQREDDSWNVEPRSNNLRSPVQLKHDNSWDTSIKPQNDNYSWNSVSAKKSQNNWNAFVPSKHDNSWDASIKPQNDNDSWNSVSAQPVHDSNWDSSVKPQNDNDNWNSVSAKKSQNNWNTSMQPERTGWTLTDEPKEINYVSPVVNPTRSNSSALSQSEHDVISTWNAYAEDNEEKHNHLIRSVPRKDVPSKTKLVDKVPKSDESRQFRKNIIKIKTSTEETQIRGNEVKIASASPIDPNVSNIDANYSDASDVNKESNVEATSPISPTKARPQVIRFSKDTKIEPKENPDYLKSDLLTPFVQLAEESSRNAKDSSTAALTQPKDEKVQESFAKINSIEPFKSLIDEEILFYGDAKNQEKNTIKAKESDFGWGTEEKALNSNQSLIESDSSDEESIKSNSSTKEPRSPTSPNLIDSFNIPLCSTLSIKPTTITIPNQKKPPEIKSPLRATIQSPESETVDAYVFYNHTFVKENSVLVNLEDDDQSAPSPPNQSPQKQESEAVFQELAELDWKPFIQMPDPNSIKWAKPTDREQKQKKKE